MSPENEKFLMETYPSLFPPNPTLESSCMFWGCECGDGWFEILKELCAELSQLGVQLAQVKEKWGTLCVYLDGYTKEAEEVIARAEEKSAVTCEVCGEPGTINQRGWLSVKCPSCRSESSKTF